MPSPQLCNNNQQPYQHNVRRPSNNNHFISSKITKFYTTSVSNRIPTIKPFKVKKYVNISITLTNPSSLKSTVRNTSLKSQLNNINTLHKNKILSKRKINTVDKTTLSNLPTVVDSPNKSIYQSTRNCYPNFNSFLPTLYIAVIY